MGPNVTSAYLFNAASLPLFRKGVGCLSSSSANVVALSSVDLVLAPADIYTVSTSYIGNTAPLPSPSVCASSGSYATKQSPFAPVIYKAGVDGMVSITATISVATSTMSLRRQMQAVTSANLAAAIAMLGGGSMSSPSVQALQLAQILQNLGQSMGYVSTVTTADSDGNYNYSGIASMASGGGLAPPSSAVLTQLGPWLASLNKNLRISQLSSVVFTSGVLVISTDIPTAAAAGALVITGVPVISAASSASSNTGVIVGVLVAVCIVGAGVAFFVFRRRRGKKTAKTFTNSRIVEIKVPGGGVGQSFRDTRHIVASTPINVPFVNPSINRAVFTPTEINTGVDDVVATRQVNAMKYFSQQRSTAVLGIRSSSRRTVATEEDIGRVAAISQTIEDANGRRAFTSSGIRDMGRLKPLKGIRDIHVNDESDDDASRVLPTSKSSRKSDSDEGKSSRKIDSGGEDRHRSSKKSSRVVEEEDTGETKHRRTSSKSSRKIADEDDNTAEDAKAAAKAKRRKEKAEAKAAEEAKMAAEAKAAEEAKMAAEAKAAEEAKLAAEAKAAEEAKVAAETKAAEEAKLAAEAKAAEEAKVAAEVKAAADAKAARRAARKEKQIESPREPPNVIITEPPIEPPVIKKKKSKSSIVVTDSVAPATEPILKKKKSKATFDPEQI